MCIRDRIGPDNTFRKNSPPSTEPLTVDVDPLEAVARIGIQGQQLVLKEGEWSGWVPVEFQLMPVIGNVKGICRFYLKQTHPRFQLYVSPINIDPEAVSYTHLSTWCYQRARLAEAPIPNGEDSRSRRREGDRTAMACQGFPR